MAKSKQQIGALGEHDVGGKPVERLTIGDQGMDKPIKYWEQQSHALLAILAHKKLICVDELRRAIEHLPKQVYNTATYFGRWSRAYISILLEKGVISEADIVKHIFSGQDIFNQDYPKEKAQVFQPGDEVTVNPEDFSTFWLRPHLRTPGYLHGAAGIVKDYIGSFNAPNVSAFWNRTTGKQHLYRVVFKQKDVWDKYEGNEMDEISIEIFQPWLSKCTATDASLHPPRKKFKNVENVNKNIHHGSISSIEQEAVEREGKPSMDELLTKGVVNLLVAKGILTNAQLNQRIEANQAGGSVINGARIVIKAWKDTGFQSRLKKNANEAVKELGLEASNAHAFTKLVCVFNEAKVHNVIVCTLCSCYPSTLLGGSPSWYKARSYRSRVVIEPRKVLKEFGTHLPLDVKIVVHDSTADCRYMVIPSPPVNFREMSDEQLIAYVTRNRLIGVNI